MRRAFWLAGLAIAVLALAAPAQAIEIIDFNLAGPTPGLISYAGGASPLKGIEIQVDNVFGAGTPLNNGSVVPITGGLLNFTTGNLISYAGGVYTFGGGGSIAVSGTADFGQGAKTYTDLLFGTFTGATVQAISSSVYNVVLGGFTDTKALDLLNYFGMPTAGVQYGGAINLQFYLVNDVSTGGFHSDPVLSGDITNTVPEPGSMILLGSGLIGLAAAVRRRLKK